MATLVLSTVGSALGGPIGGAIGALIGQSLDQQLLGPASRGPRLGDLSVQTSSYGTQVPRIYGSMRVAGSVVWATNLAESDQTTGAKGQPDVVYSYSVSLAVALSSRPAGAIGRIWADGKLLRGAEADFKVPVTFRFYDGGESQEIDPLIASIEGIENTPAYRGLALAVFENLELADFGNRIPFMTFEVLADPEPPTVSSILADASGGNIAADASNSVVGYAAYGRSTADAVQSLVECFDLSLFDDGALLRAPLDASPLPIASDELGNSANGDKAAKMQREQLPVRSVPSALRLTYYDADRDYQSGEVRAIAGEQGANEVQRELPAVLSTDDAKALVHQMLARQWSARDRLTLRLPPERIGLEPGSIIQPDAASGSWIVDKCTIDGFVAIAEMRPSWRPTVLLSAEAGRIVANDDIVEGPVTLALIDMQNPMGVESAGPTILIAASSPSPAWRGRSLTVTCSGQTLLTQTAVRKSVLGNAVTVLADAEPYLIDDSGIVEVQLVDDQQWLTSCTDDALAGGMNMAVLGSELIQFGTVTSLGQGRFRLSHLLRGRGGTEWANASHSVGETFCLLEGNSVRALTLPAWMRGSVVTVVDRNGSIATLLFGAESVRPLAPVDLTGAVDTTGDLALSWTRRSRAGFAWLDEIDAPLGETREQYRVTVSGTAAEVELTSDEPALVVTASDLASLGTAPAAVEVRQIGDWAASRAAQLTISLSQE